MTIVDKDGYVHLNRFDEHVDVKGIYFGEDRPNIKYNANKKYYDLLDIFNKIGKTFNYAWEDNTHKAVYNLQKISDQIVEAAYAEAENLDGKNLNLFLFDKNSDLLLSKHKTKCYITDQINNYCDNFISDFTEIFPTTVSHLFCAEKSKILESFKPDFDKYKLHHDVVVKIRSIIQSSGLVFYRKYLDVDVIEKFDYSKNSNFVLDVYSNTIRTSNSNCFTDKSSRHLHLLVLKKEFDEYFQKEFKDSIDAINKLEAKKDPEKQMLAKIGGSLDKSYQDQVKDKVDEYVELNKKSWSFKDENGSDISGSYIYNVIRNIKDEHDKPYYRAYLDQHKIKRYIGVKTLEKIVKEVLHKHREGYRILGLGYPPFDKEKYFYLMDNLKNPLKEIGNRKLTKKLLEKYKSSHKST